MRALAKWIAEFIMRGRRQAAMAAVLGYVVPLLTPATLALVTLRRGALDGTLVLFIGLSPAVLSIVFGDSTSPILWITLLSLVVIYVPALLLRSTISLPFTVLGIVLTSTVVALVVMTFAPEAVEQLMRQLTQGLAQDAEVQEPVAMLISQAGMSGMIAYILALNSITGVLLGRWLQALLYNEGGFSEEFHGLRLGLAVASICFVGSVLCRLQGSEYWWWGSIFAIPLVLVAIAVAHSIVKQYQLSTPWLVLFYFAVFLFSPIVMCIGFLDTWFNFRQRFQKTQ